MKLLTIATFYFFSLSLSAQVLTFEDVKNADKKRDIPKDFDQYHSENGEVFRVGEIISIASPSSNKETYEHIMETDGFATAQRPGLEARGWDSEIVKFKVTGTKRAGYQVTAVSKTEVGVYRYWIELEDAIKTGEIETSILTREEAIKKLKEAKDLLDLDMMPKDEYEALRAELAPIIKGEN